MCRLQTYIDNYPSKVIKEAEDEKVAVKIEIEEKSVECINEGCKRKANKTDCHHKYVFDQRYVYYYVVIYVFGHMNSLF
jgi:hypothetical protein